ncbi:MAG: DUF3015 domain-containing protein [Pseudomonadota bacterium]
MKKLIIAAALIGASTTAMAEAPGGPGCGWGNMLLKGQSGLPMHLLATITNGTSGNATFGMTTGTNGCSTSGKLSYNGKSLIGMTSTMLDEIAADTAVGQGDALTALAVLMGVQPEDRAAFSQLAHQNFSTLFPRADVTSGEFVTALLDLMKQDAQLAKYAA